MKKAVVRRSIARIQHFPVGPANPAHGARCDFHAHVFVASSQFGSLPGAVSRWRRPLDRSPFEGEFGSHEQPVANQQDAVGFQPLVPRSTLHPMSTASTFTENNHHS